MGKRYIAAAIAALAICAAPLAGCRGAGVADGVYSADVESDSSMFRVIDCKLTVSGGKMTAAITLSGQGYGELYLGAAEKAETAGAADCYPFTDTADEKHAYEFPLAALDKPIAVAAKGLKKGTWYDHTLTFKGGTLKPYTERVISDLPDGDYKVGVTLTGGSGRAGVESPAALAVREGRLTATVIWSSPNYTYMIVDGEKYLPVNTEGNSTFEIPIRPDADMAITAQTVAMSEPKEIEYTLRFERASVTLALVYAENFSVSYGGGAPVVTFHGGASFTPGRRPQRIYLAATSAMCLYDGLGGLDALAYSGTKPEGWYIENARAAMEQGRITYAGKYSAPDYELLLSGGCDLAIESTMINHAPEVKEKLEALGIPVITDMSSYEPHPLGRTEWIKLYGVLLGKERQAAELFDAQAASLAAVEGKPPTGKSVAFFYVNSAGLPVVRKSGDYVAKMIALAGGKYVFDDIGGTDTATGTVTIEMEAFYNAAKNADVVIYNSTIGEELDSLEALLAKSGLLTDFKAAQSGNVWQASKNFYQDTTAFGVITAEMRKIFEGGGIWEIGGLDYFGPLRPSRG